MNIIFLETKLNLTWTSMEEILPQIEEAWSRTCKKEGDYFHRISVDNSLPGQYIRELMNADLIIVSAFNTKVAGFLKIVRASLGLQIPWAIYLHNQATIGLWPFYEFGIGELLRESDTFIGTCSGDGLAMKALFERCRYKLIPFVSETPVNERLALESAAREVVYVGRISEQKNLHSLIAAISLLKKEGSVFHLTLYGKEDFLGSPNMARKSDDYLLKLKNLAAELGLEGQVSFMGFRKREEIEERLKESNVIFCSPSLHSDENFGMAALMAVRSQCRLVLSNWGGHKNYIDQLPEITKGVAIYQNGDGPFLRVRELAQSISKAQALQGEFSIDASLFSVERSEGKMSETLNDYRHKTEEAFFPLKSTPIHLQVLAKRETFKEAFPQRSFSDYNDPLAAHFFHFYGAEPVSSSEESYDQLLPWVEERAGSFQVRDPHKGERLLSQRDLKPRGYTY